MAAALSRLAPRTATLAGGAVIVAFAATSAERAAMYRSQEAMAEYVSSEYLSADPASLNPRERYFAAKMRAQRALVAGRIEEGLESLLEADRIAPALPDHLPVIAQAELDLGHPERAAQALERLLSPAFAATPAFVKQRADFGNDTLSRLDRADAWHLLGRAYVALGRGADADAAFGNAAREARGRPDEAAYLVDLALQLERSGRTAEAGAALDRAAALRPEWDRPRTERSKLGGSAR
jgi:tetratricopeptide (TPR) repeat protein